MQGTALTAPSSSRPGLDILASGLGPLLPCPFAGVHITLLWHLVLPGEPPAKHGTPICTVGGPLRPLPACDFCPVEAHSHPEQRQARGQMDESGGVLLGPGEGA